MPEPRKSLARSLGEFVGHIAAGLRTDPASPDSARRVQTTAHQELDDQGRTVVVRRTVIEEVEVRPAGPDPANARPTEPDPR